MIWKTCYWSQARSKQASILPLFSEPPDTAESRRLKAGVRRAASLAVWNTRWFWSTPPSRTSSAVELAAAAAQGNRGVLLVVKGEIADDVSAKVEDSGVFVIPKPVNRAFLHQALKLVLAARNRFLGLREENVRLQSKIEEIRLVDRAKCILIERCALSEPEAHRYIEKLAMDRRTTRRIIAEEVLANRLPEQDEGFCSISQKQ